MSDNTNGTFQLQIEQMVREDVQERIEAAAAELERTAGRLRELAADLDHLGVGQSYVAVCGSVSSEVHTRTAGLRLDRLATAALQADLARARVDVP